MQKEILQTEHAPKAVGPYAQGVFAPPSGRMLFLSGQLPLSPKTGEMPASVESQTKQCLENVRALVKAAGGSLANIVKTTVFLQDMADFAAMNQVYASFFEAPFPARACVAVLALPKGALVEIEAIAVLD